MDNLESVYDADISPLIKQILAICQAKGLPMFATFKFSDTGACTSCLKPMPVQLLDHLQALNESAQNGLVNIDVYLTWVEKQARRHGHSSMYLHRLGIPFQAPPSVPLQLSLFDAST